MKEERDAYLMLVLFALKQGDVSVEELSKWLNSDEHKAKRSYYGIVEGTPERAKIITAYNERKEQILAAMEKAA